MKRSISFSTIFRRKEEDQAPPPSDQTDRAALAQRLLGRSIKLAPGNVKSVSSDSPPGYWDTVGGHITFPGEAIEGMLEGRARVRAAHLLVGDVWRRRWGLLMLAVTAATRLSAQAQERILGDVAPTSGLILNRPEALAGKDNAILNRGGTVFLTLLWANSLKEPPQPVSTTTRPRFAEPSRAASSKPMTMLAISCYDQDATPSSSQSFSILCRTEGNLSNATPNGRIVMKGVVTQDVVSSGKILIEAGSKVSGIGHVDPDTGRIEAKGDWSIVTENQEIQVRGEAQDTAGGFHGIPGQETSFENQLSERQAVVRDGRYCFLPDKTPFVLSITGAVTIRVLQPLESSK